MSDTPEPTIEDLAAQFAFVIYVFSLCIDSAGIDPDSVLNIGTDKGDIRGVTIGKLLASAKSKCIAVLGSFPFEAEPSAR